MNRRARLMIQSLATLLTVLGPVAAGPVSLSQIHGGFERVIVGFDPGNTDAWSAVHRHPVGLERGSWAGNFYDARCFPSEVATHGIKFVFEKSGGLVYGLRVKSGDSIVLPEPASVVSVAYAAVCWWENGRPFKRVTLIVEDSHGRRVTTDLTLADWCAHAFQPHYVPDHNFLVCEFDHRLRVEERKVYPHFLFIVIPIPIGITWEWHVVGPRCGVWAFRLSASELGLRDITRIEFRYDGGHLYILAVTITPAGPFDDIVGGPGCSGTTVGPGGMDEVGSCYWEGEWPARFRPTTVTVNGVPFLIPPADGPNALLANGCLIELPRPAHTVWFLYAATNWWFGGKPHGPLDLVVVDDRGKTVTARVLLVDWCAHDTVPNNVEVLTFDHRAVPGGLQPVHCGVWAFKLEAGQLGLPNIKAVYFPSMGRRKVWILGATLDGQPVRLEELRLRRISHPWPGFRTDVVYPGDGTLDGTFLLPRECRVRTTPIAALVGDGSSNLSFEDGKVVWVPVGNEVVPLKLHERAFDAIGARIALPRDKHVTAVYVLYAATCWWDKDGDPVDAVPVTVCYDDGNTYSTAVGIIDWCATDPRAYDDGKRRIAAACAVLPQLEAHWVWGEPLVYQVPALVFPKRLFRDGRTEPNTKRPILWLLKLVFPPEKRPTWIEFGYHPGHLWILAITVRDENGCYYALDKNGCEALGEPEQEITLEPRPYEDYLTSSTASVLTADAEVWVGGTGVKVTAEYCEPDGIRIEAPGLELRWPLWTHCHGSAITVTVRVPAGHLNGAVPTPYDPGLERLRERLRDELVRTAVSELASVMPLAPPDVIIDPYTGRWYEVPEDVKEEIRRYLEELYTSTLSNVMHATNVTVNTARGDAFAALTLVTLYDRLAVDIAGRLGVRVYRAVPAYVTVLTAWSADLQALAEYLRDKVRERTECDIQVTVPQDYLVSTFTQFLIYQPTLGLEVYGPPLEARTVSAVLSLLLPGLEQAVLEIGRGVQTVEMEQSTVDWAKVRDHLRKALEKIGVDNPEGTAWDVVNALRFLADLSERVPRIEALSGTHEVREIIFDKAPDLESTVLPYGDVTTWTSTVYTLFPVPSKGAAIASACFHGPMTENLFSFLKREFVYYLAYHALGNAGLSFLLSGLLSRALEGFLEEALAAALAEVGAVILAPVIVAGIKGLFFNDWGDWNALRMFANEVASTCPTSFTSIVQWYAKRSGGGKAGNVAKIVSFAFAYLSSVCTGAKLP